MKDYLLALSVQMKDYLLTLSVMGPIVYFCLGFLCAALLIAVLTPFVRQRALRVAQQRRRAAVQLVAKVRAKKNEMSAEFARSIRNFEIMVEELKDTVARQRVELGRHRDNLNQLKVERNALKLEVGALRDQALPNSDAPSLQPSTSKPGPMFLPLELIDPNRIRIDHSFNNSKPSIEYFIQRSNFQRGIGGCSCSNWWENNVVKFAF